MTVVVAPADYRGEAVTGKRWRRVNRVVITNPYGGAASVALDEEEVTVIEDAVKTRSTETLGMEVDLAAQVPIYDPTTGAPTGDVTTQGQVYVALYSLYRQIGRAHV